MESRRNLPERFDRAVDGNLPAWSEERLDQLKMVYNQARERVSQGIDPAYVGELVREGIENDWPYIFTDLEFELQIEARFAAIKQGFDQIRDRVPRR
jgi:hypothetical protein